MTGCSTKKVELVKGILYNPLYKKVDIVLHDDSLLSTVGAIGRYNKQRSYTCCLR